MTLHKTRLQRTGREKKEVRGFFVALGVITVLLIIVLYMIYGE